MSSGTFRTTFFVHTHVVAGREAVASRSWSTTKRNIRRIPTISRQRRLPFTTQNHWPSGFSTKRSRWQRPSTKRIRWCEEGGAGWTPKIYLGVGAPVAGRTTTLPGLCNYFQYLASNCLDMYPKIYVNKAPVRAPTSSWTSDVIVDFLMSSWTSDVPIDSSLLYYVIHPCAASW